MSKIYLKPGEHFIVHWLPIIIGETGTCADPILKWSPDSGGEGIGNITRGGFQNGRHYTELDFLVYVDESDGRFWYEDEDGS